MTDMEILMLFVAGIGIGSVIGYMVAGCKA